MGRHQQRRQPAPALLQASGTGGLMGVARIITRMQWPTPVLHRIDRRQHPLLLRLIILMNARLARPSSLPESRYRWFNARFQRASRSHFPTGSCRKSVLIDSIDR